MRAVTHIFLFILFMNCRAQQLYFYIPDKLRQIPSSETYNIMQDSKGYIWFSAEAGLCRYNGSSLKIFDKQNGLPEASVYAVKEDRKGVIWIATSDNRILHYSNDTLKEAPFSADFRKRIRTTHVVPYMLNFTDDSIYINTMEGQLIAGRSSKQVDKVIMDESPAFKFRAYADFLLYSSTRVSPTMALDDIIKKKQLQVVISGGQTAGSYVIPYSAPGSPSFRILSAVGKNGDYYISFDNLLVKIGSDGATSSQNLPYPIISLYVDKEEGLWAGTLKGGVFYYKPGSGLAQPVLNLSGFSVSGTTEDNENGMWCATLEKGVFYCRNKYVKKYPDIRGFEKKAELLKTVGSSVFVSSLKNELIEIKRSGIAYHQFHSTDLYYLSDILQRKDSAWLLTGRAVFKTDKRFRKMEYLGFAHTTRRVNARQFCSGPSGRIFVLQATAVFEMRGDEGQLRTVLPSPGRCLGYAGGNDILLGCRDGLFRIDVNTLKHRQVKHVKGNVTKIMPVRDGEAWIITKGNGIYFLKGEQVFNISDSLKLPTDRLLDITKDRHGTLWIGSNIGLIKLVYVSGKPVVTIYNTFNGLPSNEIFNVTANDEELFLSTNEGICSFPLQADLSNVSRPGVILSAVSARNRQVTDPGRFFELNYTENALQVDFDLLTYKGTQTILYRLESESEEPAFGSVSGNKLILSNLKPGKYTLSAYAVNNNKVLSEQPAILSFAINKPFWQTIAFIFLCNMMLCLTIVFIARFLINRIRQKEKEKTRINKLIAEYQLSALRAQMNPHFIFNCINSIQRYILTNKPEEAYNYLSKFSKLIRLVLDYAEENLITLAQELEIVTLYLQLEQQRFEHKFNYIVSVHDDIDPQTARVPSMMLQPYVENAIWHGLMNITDERDRFISIQFKCRDKVLKIIIEDNGVGRERAAELSSRKYRPKANDINQKRTEMLNILVANKGSILIEDIKQGDEVAGTRVTIHIPQENSDE